MLQPAADCLEIPSSQVRGSFCCRYHSSLPSRTRVSLYGISLIVAARLLTRLIDRIKRLRACYLKIPLRSLLILTSLRCRQLCYCFSDPFHSVRPEFRFSQALKTLPAIRFSKRRSSGSYTAPDTSSQASPAALLFVL